MQNASAADDDDAEYEADGENDECNENATIMAIPRTTRARIIRLLGLIIVLQRSATYGGRRGRVFQMETRGFLST